MLKTKKITQPHILFQGCYPFRRFLLPRLVLKHRNCASSHTVIDILSSMMLFGMNGSTESKKEARVACYKRQEDGQDMGNCPRGKYWPWKWVDKGGFVKMLQIPDKGRVPEESERVLGRCTRIADKIPRIQVSSWGRRYIPRVCRSVPKVWQMVPSFPVRQQTQVVSVSPDDVVEETPRVEVPLPDHGPEASIPNRRSLSVFLPVEMSAGSSSSLRGTRCFACPSMNKSHDGLPLDGCLTERNCIERFRKDACVTTLRASLGRS